jgi:hypothetical protein
MEHRAKIFTPSLTLPPRGGGMGGGGLCSVFFFMLFVTLLLFFVFCPSLFAGIKDRVVAFVDNAAITLSELEMKYAATVKVIPDITRNEVLDTMVNRVLLLSEAKNIRLEAPSEDELLREYIDLRIKTLISIKEEELTDFYEKHIDDFQGKDFETVREKIENYLIENELNQRLKSHVNELREKACIKIQLNRDKESN